METLLISLILLLVLILVVVTVQEIASNALLPPREKISFIAVVIACPHLGFCFTTFSSEGDRKIMVWFPNFP